MTLTHADATTPVVYLIDDDPNDVLIIRRLCESVGLAVQCYESPQTFLSDLHSNSHGCIVADLLMPEMTGLQLHTELQKAGSGLPIIVVTGHADARTCRTALHNGVFDFVEKSFNPHDLLVVIREAIDQNAKHNQARHVRNSYLAQLEVLSPREREVMQVLTNGLTLKEIAAQFNISVQTASKHRSNLFEKLGITNEVDLLKLLLRIDHPHGFHGPLASTPAAAPIDLTSSLGSPGPGLAAVPGSD
jgi:FixJ family two-component response regulator